ncbi:HEAT repeat domain-containing protein [Methylomonas sp. EFPC3]|uniref:HEAT repeat domain-containing protein n=1 Tax=Methylomonas sp. EFPC3 TaxID=3021710 RepID=UPI0024169E2D|nr:HEAT repeat domain-containing protein [Methylomonas sp. EFPC3]WFP48566.1 HEAT repeat domain-containing protein [Methylomonas sp. EFPC3]
MRRLNFNSITALTALTAVLISGYFISDSGQTSATQTKAGGGNVLAAKARQLAKQNGLIRAVQAGAADADSFDTALFAEEPQSQADDALQNQSVEQLLETIESFSLQDKPNEEIRDSKEFQQLLYLLTSDPLARKGLLERFMSVSGTPWGDTLSLALAMSVVGRETPEVKAAATQLLRSGTAEQRLNALQMLGQVDGNDGNIRSALLDILRNDADANPKLATAAMATLSQKGMVSQEDYQAVADAIVPLAHSQDPQVRQSSLQILSQWAGRDATALQTFTEAAYDADARVRALAVAALGQGGFDYQSVRDTLISTLQNPAEASYVKAAAQQALEVFPLDEQALTIYQVYASESLSQQSSAGFN